MDRYYQVVENIRMARREKSVILLNAYNSITIEMDENSETLFTYIKNNRPTKEKVIAFGKNLGIIQEEVEAFLVCLEETGFIYEDRNI